MSINEVCYSSLLLCEAESFCYSVFILRTCNLNSNYSLGYLEEYGHPDNFNSLSSSLYTFKATKHIQT